MTARIKTAVITVLSISLIISLILCLLLTAQNTGYLSLSGFLLILLISVYWVGRKSNNLAGIMLLAIVINSFIVVPELFLRVIDFHYESGIQNKAALSFGGLRPDQYMHFEPDEKLFWKLPPAHEHVNSLGFSGPEIVTPKPANVYRILFLGDSVTQLGFAQYVEFYLNKYLAGGTLQFECATLAVSGYSSYQGKVIAELYADSLEADLAFVMFGWNDHWLAYRKRDALFKTAEYPYILWQIYHNSRILQLANRTFHLFMNTQADGVINQVRVLPREYSRNLMQIDSIFKQSHIPVVLMTAPTAFYRLGVPDYLVQNKLGVSKDSIISLHREYNQIERQLAQTQNIPLLDLEKEYDTLAELPELFIADGIHFTNKGSEYTAQYIFDFIKNNYINQTDNTAAK